MIRAEKTVSYTYKVIDEKYTRPSDLEKNVSRFISNVLTELLPLAKTTRPKDILLRLKQEYDKYKEQAATKQKTKRRGGEEKKRNQDEEFCSIFKKLRLNSDDDTPVTNNRVTHAPQCKNPVRKSVGSNKTHEKSKYFADFTDKETQTKTPPKLTSFVFTTPRNVSYPNDLANLKINHGRSKLRCFSDRIERASSAIPKLVKSCPKDGGERKAMLSKRARVLNSPGERASPPSKIPRKKSNVFNYTSHSYVVSKRLSDVFSPTINDSRGQSKIPRLSLPASLR